MTEFVKKIRKTGKGEAERGSLRMKGREREKKNKRIGAPIFLHLWNVVITQSECPFSSLCTGLISSDSIVVRNAGERVDSS